MIQPATETNPYQKLSVNVNHETTEILRRYMASRGVSATEATRRAIGLVGAMLQWEREGKTVTVRADDGRVQTVQLL